MKLTITQVQHTKPQARTIRLFDGRGLYLEISPTGGRWWRFKYQFGGKEKRISLGVFPDVGLKQAREKRDEMRQQVAAGINPGEQRKLDKLVQVEKTESTVEAITREWFNKHAPGWAKSHSEKVLLRLENDLFPWLGQLPINDVKPAQLLAVLRRIESRGAMETAHRMLQICGQIFRYAVATGRAERAITSDLRGALAPCKTVHYASITDPRRVGALLRAIDSYEGYFVTKCALKLAPLLFVRPTELRAAQWVEFDLDAAEWRIPAQRMKGRLPHIVPLSRQALDILRELHPSTGKQIHVFPGVRSRRQCMSSNTVNGALRRLGYLKTEMTAHGFRSMASTLLNEQGWATDAIERQLGHVESNSVKAAYNYAQHLPLRRKMMQAWADYLDTLKNGTEGVSVRSQEAA